MRLKHYAPLRALNFSLTHQSHSYASAAVFILPLRSSTTTTTTIRRHGHTPFPSTISSPRPRPYSSTSSSASPQPQSQAQTVLPPTPLPNHSSSSLRPPTPLDSAAANPPATTRPPPLTLPALAPGTSSLAFAHLFATGKAYLAFYRAGISYLWTNRRLVRALPPPPKPGPSSLPARTRAELQLRARWRHDVRRLPAFALVLLVCGEFTPFVVMVLPRLVPLTCRIPVQEAKLQRDAEARRAAAFAALRERRDTNTDGGDDPSLAAAHAARVLGVGSRLWERILPVRAAGLVLRGAVRRRVALLACDDALLQRAGGVAALEEPEVRLACAERGLDVLGRGDEELRTALASWSRLAGAESQDGRVARIGELLRVPEEEWSSELSEKHWVLRQDVD